MKIAIIGAGIFGCTLSLILSKKKTNKIHLYEKNSDIMLQASKYNQQRFHHGFHYPRSQKTLNEISKSRKSFEKFYGKDIFGKTKNYYGLVEKNGKTKKNEYLKFLKKNNLNFKIINHKNFSDRIDLKILTNEKILHYDKLKNKIRFLIKKSKVKLKLNQPFKNEDKDRFDYIFVCTYSENNKNLKKLDIRNLNKFRYELIEKMIIQLPNKYQKLSYVIIDGKFLCIDPYLGTKYHLLSHVKYSKLEIKNSILEKFNNSHSKKIGKFIKIKNNKNFNKYINDGKKYLPFLKLSKYIGSFFGVRVIEVNKEKTDQRTNLFKKHTKKIFSISSGKWNTAVHISNNVKEYLKL